MLHEEARVTAGLWFALYTRKDSRGSGGQLVVQITSDPNDPGKAEEILMFWFDELGNIFFEPNGMGVDFADFLKMFTRRLLDRFYEKDFPIYP